MRYIKKFWAALGLLSIELIAIIICFIAAFIAFIYIADYVFLEHKTAFDDKAFAYLDNKVSSRNTDIMNFFSYLGNYKFLVAANGLLILHFLFIRKHRWYAIKVPAIAITSTLLMLFLKFIFNRQRPLVPLEHPVAGLSFPSGHALCSMTFFGLLIFFIWKRPINIYLKLFICTILLAVVFMIGLSRIYLRVHHASDVLAGFCLGFIWLVISIKILRRIEKTTTDKMKDKNVAVV